MLNISFLCIFCTFPALLTPLFLQPCQCRTITLTCDLHLPWISHPQSWFCEPTLICRDLITTSYSFVALSSTRRVDNSNTRLVVQIEKDPGKRISSFSFSLFLLFYFIYLFILALQHVGSEFPKQGLNPSLCWKHVVLTTGASLPRKVPCLSFKLFSLLCRWIPSIQKRGIKYSLFLIIVQTVNVLVNVLMVKIKLCK